MLSSPVSLKEVAAVAGCSPRVAAAVLNPGNSNIRVGASTQQRILAVASELGYRANGLAQAMATGKSRVLGITVEGGPIEHRAWMLSGAIEAAAQRDYHVKVLSFRGLPTEVFQLCLDWRLAGLVSLSLRLEQNAYLIAQSKKFNTPLAIVDEIPADFDGINVSSDEMQGIRQVLEHLFELGHRDIGFLGADEESTISQHRTSCFRVVSKELGLRPHQSWIASSDWSDRDIIAKAVSSLLEHPRPTAIVCAGDPLAMRVIAGARALGLHVPQDLSVTGFANFFLSDMLDPPLTTIEQSFVEMGRVTIENMISLLEDETQVDHPVRRRIKIPTRLIVRDSTAPPTERIA
ncbi:HTH-type transcriptional repressor CytR [Abditibacteriota bacterium]|nr:HTH-type transcriptional repressor CytR [Abditibacteriota bacterium]